MPHVRAGRDDGDPPVDDDHPVEELVEGADLGAEGRHLGDVLAGHGVSARAVLVEGAHGDPALQRRDVPQRGGGQRRPAPACLRLRGEELLLRVAEERGQVGADRLTVQIRERCAGVGLGRSLPALAERLERLRPARGLLEQPGTLRAERRDDPRLHVGRLEGSPLTHLAVDLHQAELGEQLERILLQRALGQSGVPRGDPALLHDEVVQLDRRALEQLAVLGLVTCQHDLQVLCAPRPPPAGESCILLNIPQRGDSAWRSALGYPRPVARKGDERP